MAYFTQTNFTDLCRRQQLYGGESGIRTHGTAFSGTLDFESSAFDQLSHLSFNYKDHTYIILSYPFLFSLSINLIIYVHINFNNNIKKNWRRERDLVFRLAPFAHVTADSFVFDSVRLFKSRKICTCGIFYTG